METSSSSSSIGASSSSLSSSRGRLTPFGSSTSVLVPFVTASFASVTTATALGVEEAGTGAVAGVEDGGTLKIDCCNSVDVTAAGTVGGR